MVPHDSTIGKWQVRDVILAVLIGLFLTFVIALALSKIHFSNPVLYIVSGAAGILVNTIVIYLLKSKYPLAILSNIEVRTLVKYALIGISICIFINFPYGIWTGNIDKMPEQYVLFIGYPFFLKVVFILLLSLLGPATEEILFRGFFYRILKNRFNIYWGALISTFLFTAGHHFDIRNWILISIQGFIYLYVYEKSKSILTSILTHSLNNTLWFIFVYLGINR